MKTLRLINHIKGVLGLLVLTLWSCQDDWETNRVPEGKPATINVRIDLGKMAQLTRADMDSRLENRVNNLWVGVYNVATGLKTGEVFVNNVQREDLDYPEDVSGEIENLPARSGESYIVAVANYLNAEGFTVENDGGIVPQDLEQLLRDAETWDKYRAIALSRNYNTDNNYAIIDAPTNSVENGLVMQGSYRESGHTNDHTDDNPEKINIVPGTNSLSGKIHLRRLWSQNTINFEAAGDVISLEIIEMEVVNVPQYSWLQSRDQGENADKDHRLEYANAGDAQDPTIKDPEQHPNYLKSLKVTQPSMDMTTNAGGGTTYSYSFWQYENKRTGSITEDGTDAYAKREIENKKEDNSNSGIYTALCPNGNSLNNNATYIRFKAVITYKGTGSLKPDEINDAFDGITQRTAEATYVVHLGYIDQDVNDFNCYRNAKYTYNIKVQSVNKILVEAWNDDEYQPGAEGEVNDVTEKFYDLDCHYNVFNIYLTKEELQKFTFTMRTYDNNEAHDIKYLKKEDGKEENTVPGKDDPDNWKYYSWIQLVPNDNTDADATTIAPFPKLQANGEPEGNGALYYLKDIAVLGEQLVDEGKDGRGFTVYIKEYTYEADYGEDGYGNEASGLWKRYVNQPNRTAHFNVSFKESADKESIYYKSKYALTQKSIQTYYDVTQGTETGKESTALGIEHDNEVFGMNIRWPNEITGLSADNGRYNMYLGYGGTVLGEGTSATPSTTQWSNVLDLNNLQSINEINNIEQTKLAHHISTAERICPVPKTIEISAAALSAGTAGKYNTTASSVYDPQSGGNVQYIHALNACMNRNKDENGNGIIDHAELKWYVPASGKYLRMILGRNTLKTPLMNYEQASLPAGCSNGDNTLYHFMASDDKIIWVDEGASSCKFHNMGAAYGWIFAPWQVRCIRNLGTDLNTITNAERVLPAYDATDINTGTHGGVVKVTRYHGSALRQPQIDPLPMHKSDEAYNRIARYGFEIAPMGNILANVETYEEEKTSAELGGNGISNTTYQYYADAVRNGDFCKSLNESSSRKGWRLPNQKEIVIMLRMKGVLNDESGQQTYATCTQEHWTNYGKPVGSSSAPLGSWDYRLLTVDANKNQKVAVALNDNKTIDYIRCVRDLTAAEAGMSYSEIVAQP